MNWKEFKDLLASGRHFYSPEVLERALGGELKKYAPIARDYRMRNQKTLGVGRTRDNTSTAIPFVLPVGAPGTVAGVTLLEGLLALPGPTLLVACTVKV